MQLNYDMVMLLQRTNKGFNCVGDMQCGLQGACFRYSGKEACVCRGQYFGDGCVYTMPRSSSDKTTNQLLISIVQLLTTNLILMDFGN